MLCDGGTPWGRKDGSKKRATRRSCEQTMILETPLCCRIEWLINYGSELAIVTPIGAELSGLSVSNAVDLLALYK